MAKPKKQTKKQEIKTGSSPASWLYPGAILLLTLLVYSGSVNNFFIINWDDDGYIINNPMIKDLSWEGIKTMFTQNHIDNYHPLTTLSNAMEYAWFANKPNMQFGVDPKPFHITNLLLHLANTVLVFILIFRLLKNREAAAISAALFALHPMHVESVVWIAERKDVLYTFFFLGSLICYHRYITTKKNSLLLYSILLLLLSCLSKPAAIALSPVLVALDYYMGRKFNARVILEKLPFFAISIVFGLLALQSQGSSGSMDIAPKFPLFDKIFLSGYALVFYLVKLFAPINLSALYLYPEKENGFFPIEYYLAVVAILLLIVWVIKSGKIKKELIFGFLFYFFTLAMVIQLVSVGRAIVAERYTYVPYIGLFFILSSFYIRVRNNEFSFFGKIKKLLMPALLIVIIIFSTASWKRSKDWKDSNTLFTDLIEKQPENYYGYYARGVGKSLMNDDNGALRDYEEAIKINPRHADSWYNHGVVMEKRDINIALQDYNKCLEVKPDYHKALYNRGNVRFSLKDYAGAIDDYNKTVAINKTHAEAYCNRGVAKLTLKDSTGAFNDYNLSLKCNPRLANALYNRGNMYTYRNQVKEACEDYRKAAQEGFKGAEELINANCKPRGF